MLSKWFATSLSVLRKSALALLLLSVVGQSLQAAAMVCPEDHQGQSKGQLSVNTAQPATPCHQMVDKVVEDTQADCCASDCQCPANACHSPGSFVDGSLAVFPPLAGAATRFDIALFHDPYLSSRYRPPISA